DLTDPFGEFSEGAAILHLLECLALAGVALDLADEQDHRNGILTGDVKTCRGVRGARPAGDHADAGLAGQPAPAVGHHRRATFLAADEDVDTGVIQCVQHGEIAFPRHAGDAFDAVRLQCLNDQLAAGLHWSLPLLSMSFNSASTSAVCSPSPGLGRW